MADHIYSTQVTQGSLRSCNASPQIIARFQFNPAKVTDKRAVTYTSVEAPGQILPFQQYVKGGDRSLTFPIEIAGKLAAAIKIAGKLTAEEPPIETGADGDVSPEIRKYQALLYPVNPSWKTAGISQAKLFASRREFKAPPVCLLCLGDRSLDCILTDLSIDETMFNASLRPISASLRLTVKEIVPYGGPDLSPAGASG